MLAALCVSKKVSQNWYLEDSQQVSQVSQCENRYCDTVVKLYWVGPFKLLVKCYFITVKNIYFSNVSVLAVRKLLPIRSGEGGILISAGAGTLGKIKYAVGEGQNKWGGWLEISIEKEKGYLETRSNLTNDLPDFIIK